MENASAHFAYERKFRNDFILNEIGLGETLIEIEHPTKIVGKPDIITSISSTDILTVAEKGTGKIITRFIARPGRLRKEFGAENVPHDVMMLAVKYVRLGYCNLSCDFV